MSPGETLFSIFLAGVAVGFALGAAWHSIWYPCEEPPRTRRDDADNE